MKRVLLCFAPLLALVLCLPALGQSVKLPGELRANPGEWIIVTAKVDGGAPNWRVPAGLEEVPLGLLFPDEVLSQAKGKVFKAAKSGRYMLEAWNAKADVASDISTCIIIVGTPTPEPDPTPTPTPGPVNPAATTVVAPLAGNKAASTALGDFYGSLKVALEKDVLIKTTGQFAKAHETSLKVFVGVSGYDKLQPAPPKIGVAVDSFLGEALGPGVKNADGSYNDVAITPEMKTKLIAAVGDLASALRAL